MGTGIARGFLAAMDSGWMVKSWAQGKTPLEVLAERESIYRILPQTTPENISKNFSHYSVDPTTRYPNISLNFLKPSQVRHFCDTGEAREMCIETENVINSSTPKLARNDNCLLDKQLQESIARSSKLLNWCQRQTEGYRNVKVTDLTMSWKSGLALCALIDRYRPDLIDFVSLDERDQEKNNQLGFDVAEREFGISPCMTGKEMSSVVEPDKLSMVMYLSQFYEMFKDTVPPGDNHNMSPEEKAALISSTKSPISFLSKLGQSIAISRKRNPKDKKEKDVDSLGKRRKTSQSEDEEVSRSGRNDRPSVPAVVIERKMESCASGNQNKVKVMATQLLAKFEENAPQPSGLKRQGDSLPNLDQLLPTSPPQSPVNEPVRLAPVPAWRKKWCRPSVQLGLSELPKENHSAPFFLLHFFALSSLRGLFQKRVPRQHRWQRCVLLLSKACVRDGEAECRGEVLPSELLQVRILQHNTTTVLLRLRCGGWKILLQAPLLLPTVWLCSEEEARPLAYSNHC
ncbi:protein-methionine sulfoxide oxidase mical3a-like isoform X1 [Notothenia coriiceps]|uniref:Protein-methionine sulfoxide oxidase mical3a-like isoform X1 n=1 Tax=Notothenia coriiceps TaxID=8208 RepID=A0A6I9NBK6_9TELE|nr:PREDICTED: protein-methionine sulfoxide oxidase mical3a-like isoform X1 [Notothenia coriiceps]